MISFIIILVASLMYSNEYEVYTVKKGDSLSSVLINKGVSLNSLLGRDKSPGLLVENILINPEVENWYLLDPKREINIKLLSSDINTKNYSEAKAIATNRVNKEEKLETANNDTIKEHKIVLVSKENSVFENSLQEESNEEYIGINGVKETYSFDEHNSYFSEHKIHLGLGIIYNTETQKNSNLIKMDPSFLTPVLGYTYKFRPSNISADFEPRFLSEFSYVLKDDLDDGVDLPLNLKFEIGLARYATWTLNDTSISPYIGFGYRTDNTVTSSSTLAKEARTSKTFYLSFSPEFETVFNNFKFAYNLFYNFALDTKSEGDNFSNYELGINTGFNFNNGWSYFVKYYYSYFENKLETVNIVSHNAILGIAYKI